MVDRVFLKAGGMDGPQKKEGKRNEKRSAAVGPAVAQLWSTKPDQAQANQDRPGILSRFLGSFRNKSKGTSTSKANGGANAPGSQDTHDIIITHDADINAPESQAARLARDAGDRIRAAARAQDAASPSPQGAQPPITNSQGLVQVKGIAGVFNPAVPATTLHTASNPAEVQWEPEFPPLPAQPAAKVSVTNNSPAEEKWEPDWPSNEHPTTASQTSSNITTLANPTPASSVPIPGGVTIPEAEWVAYISSANNAWMPSKPVGMPVEAASGNPFAELLAAYWSGQAPSYVQPYQPYVPYNKHGNPFAEPCDHEVHPQGNSGSSWAGGACNATSAQHSRTQSSTASPFGEDCDWLAHNYKRFDFTNGGACSRGNSPFGDDVDWREYNYKRANFTSTGAHSSPFGEDCDWAAYNQSRGNTHSRNNSSASSPFGDDCDWASINSSITSSNSGSGSGSPPLASCAVSSKFDDNFNWDAYNRTHVIITTPVDLSLV